MAWKEGRKDLTGQVFGRLTVIGFSHTNNKRLSYWKVTCSCGAQKVVRGASLIAGEIRSCGCLQKESIIKQRLDLTGEVFGRLTVLEFSHINKNRQTMWRVQCSCGNQKIMGGSTIKNGYATSCGCLNYELESKGNHKNLVGRVFGKLTVVERTNKRARRQILWRCSCSCGQETCVRTGSLTSGATRSCGCLVQENHYKIHGQSYTKEYRAWLSLRRFEKSKLFDSSWEFNMSFLLRDLFSACVICGNTRDLCVDHLLPLNLGYGLFVDNCVILCKSCNSKKTDTYITELPKEIRQKLINASCDFQDYYDNINRLGDFDAKSLYAA